MKKQIILIITFLTFTCSFSQLYVGSKNLYKHSIYQDFLNSETIFLLPDYYTEQQYESILKDVWTITPYKIVNPSNFDTSDIFSSKKSMFQIEGKSLVSERGIVLLLMSLRLGIVDGENIYKKLSKLSEKKRERKFEEILSENTFDIAFISLFPKADFSSDDFYERDVFFNFKLGFLKNYFKKINDELVKKNIYAFEEYHDNAELKKLRTNKLYIPSYITKKFKKFKGIDGEVGELNHLFEEYLFDYEIMDDDKLNQKILDEEEFYYLRFVRRTTDVYISIVNSKTGNEVYNEMSKITYNLKSKHIRRLNKMISKAK